MLDQWGSPVCPLGCLGGQTYQIYDRAMKKAGSPQGHERVAVRGFDRTGHEIGSTKAIFLAAAPRSNARRRRKPPRSTGRLQSRMRNHPRRLGAALLPGPRQASPSSR